MAAKKKAKNTRAKKVRKATTSLKKSAKNKASQSKKKASPRKKKASPSIKKAPVTKTLATSSQKESKHLVNTKARTRSTAFSRASNMRALSADADSQGLSTVESADSESVRELLDEGNTFEAGGVEGVERADDADEREVRTREVPEDDVPEEYLDQD